MRVASPAPRDEGAYVPPVDGDTFVDGGGCAGLGAVWE